MKTNSYSKGIGFKNFRRFEEFPMLKFGKITYMVGRNNSGKSTMVKALLLVMDYLQNQLGDTFSFDNQVLEDANIVTFGRAKCNTQEEPVIVFEFQIGSFKIEMIISGEDDSTKADVNKLTIIDEDNGYYLSINYLTGFIQIKKKSLIKNNDINKKNEQDRLDIEITELIKQKELLKTKSSKDALKLTSLINDLEYKKQKLILLGEESEKLDNLIYNLEYPIKYQIEEIKENTLKHYNQDIEDFYDEDEYNEDDEIEMEKWKKAGVFNSEEFNRNNKKELTKEEELNNLEVPRTEGNPLKEIISTFLYHNRVAYIQQFEKRFRDDGESIGLWDGSDSWDLSENDVQENSILQLEGSKNKLTDWIDELIHNIENEKYFYLGANPSKQSALFPIRAKGNALAQAIHEFIQLGIQKGDKEWSFVIDWMKKFEVGDDFEIHFYAGEAYEFHVLKDGKRNHLADKGMGSLQAMSLILKVAGLMRLNKKSKKTITLLIEEPELNLHPALQSNLTDFFHEVNEKEQFNLIIETHSEYVIRKSQVFVHDKEYSDDDNFNINPFKVFYFPIDDSPYKMLYRKDGKFSNEFKPGFFDISSDLAFDIL